MSGCLLRPGPNKSRVGIVRSRMYRCLRLVVPAGAAVAAAAALALPVSAADSSQMRSQRLTEGTVSGTRWEVTVAARTIDSNLPALCFAFMFGAGYGDGGTNCVAPATGHSVKGPPWTFNPGAEPYDGLSPPAITRTAGGLRALVFLVVGSARQVVVRLNDGEVLRPKLIQIPSTLHRPGAIAVSVRQLGSRLPPMVSVKSGVAYNSKGKIVGRFSGKAPPLEDFTYG